MDYFGDAGLLVVTIPGRTHILLAWELQHHIRQTLYGQGFFWRVWGPGIRNVCRTGPWKNEFTCEGADMSSLESEGGLRIIGVTRPFLTIEVADKGGYKRASERAIESLMGSNGNIRFAIIVDLVQKPRIEPSVSSVESNYVIDLTKDDETDERAEFGNINIVPSPSNSNKRAVGDKLDGRIVIDLTEDEETDVNVKNTNDEETNVHGMEETGGEGTDVNAKEDTEDKETNVNVKNTKDEETNVHGKEETGDEGTDVNAKDKETNAKTNVIVIDLTNDEETDERGEFGNINMVPPASNVNKRAAEDDVDDSYIHTKRHAPCTGPPSPSASVEVNSTKFHRDSSVCSSIIPSVAAHQMYASITMTVLTTRVVQHSSAPGKKQRICVTLIDKAECWPAIPGPNVIFRFTWEDMNAKSYPTELQGRLFSIDFGWLHDLLQLHFTGDCQVPEMDSDDEHEVEQIYDYPTGELPIHEDHENPVDSGRKVSEDNGSEPHDSEYPFNDEDIIHDGYPPDNSDNEIPAVNESHVRKDTFRSRLPVIKEEDEHMAEAEMMIDGSEEFMDYMNGLISCGGCHADASRKL